MSDSRLPAGVRASVIVVSHNHRHQLGRCLASLAATTEAELILVDNASSDGSADFVDENFPNVRIIRNETNRGFGGASNLGASQAVGEYLAFLNPDTTIEPGWLDALIGALEADPLAGLATSKILLLNDPERINTCGNDTHITGLTLCRGMGAEHGDLRELEEVNAVSGAAFVLRRELFQELGGFDETFFLYMEDTDLSWRARLAGLRCLCVPSSVVLHDYALRFGPHKTFFQERNRYLMLLKSLRWRTLLVLLPALLLGEIVTWGFSLLCDRRRLGNKLRAYYWVLGNWQRVMAERRRTQELRQVCDRDLLETNVTRLGFEQTGQGLAARIAHLLFDPLFAILRQLALVLLRSEKSS
jgi:GT2 family glycosyltransferase